MEVFDLHSQLVEKLKVYAKQNGSRKIRVRSFFYAVKTWKEISCSAIIYKSKKDCLFKQFKKLCLTSQFRK